MTFLRPSGVPLTVQARVSVDEFVASVPRLRVCAPLVRSAPGGRTRVTLAFSAVRSGDGLRTVAVTVAVSLARWVVAATSTVTVGCGVTKGVSGCFAVTANGSAGRPSTVDDAFTL